MEHSFSFLIITSTNEDSRAGNNHDVLGFGYLWSTMCLLVGWCEVTACTQASSYGTRTHSSQHPMCWYVRVTAHPDRSQCGIRGIHRTRAGAHSTQWQRAFVVPLCVSNFQFNSRTEYILLLINSFFLSRLVIFYSLPSLSCLC